MSAGRVVLAWLLVFLSAAEAAKPTPDHAPTFAKDVAPIFYRECVNCHRPDGGAPFSLLSYEDAKRRAKLISEMVDKRLMPPWLPEPGPVFHHERRLTEAEIATIKAWARSGTAKGLQSEMPAIPMWTKEWQLGTPDLIVTLPQPFAMPAEGRDVYRNFVIPNVSDRDRFVRAVEFRPGNTQAIHHAFVLTDET